MQVRSVSGKEAGVNPTRLSAPEAGNYEIFCFLYWNNIGSGGNSVVLRLNSSARLAAQTIPNFTDANLTYSSISTVYKLAAGDYVECSAYTSTAGGNDITGGGEPFSEFGMVKLN